MARRYRRPDLDSPFWWLGFLVSLCVLALYLAMLALWLVWALIALPIAGVANLTRHDDLAGQMIDSLKWKILRLR